jgi:hypothetical protein
MKQPQPPYVAPLPGTGLPKGLSLDVFLQTVIVGISGLPGTLVRPKWQVEPPKNPPITTDWLAMGTSVAQPDASAYVGLNGSGQVTTQRHEVLEVPLSIYGPNMYDTYGLLRDGFQLPQNRIALFQANMAFTEITAGRRIPDLVNQRWVDRVECSVFLRREIQRTYPILTFTSASGTIYVPDVNESYELTFQAQAP